MAVSIDFSELYKVHQQLIDYKDISIAEPLITKSFVKFNDVLGDRVSKLYAHPKKLNDISTNLHGLPKLVNKGMLEYSVTYPHRLTSLTEYPLLKEKVATPTAKFPKRMPNSYVIWTPSRFAEQVSVIIRRGKPFVTSRTDKNLKGFHNKSRNVIMARKQRATWKVYPSYLVEGERAPYSEIYAPSLAQLGSITFDKDPTVILSVDFLYEDIQNILLDNATILLTKG